MHRFPLLRRACAVLLAVIIAIPMVAFANSEDTELKTGVVTTDNLRLRSEPSLSASIITKANTNDVVLVQGSIVENKDGKWYNVTYDAKTGYMSATYIKISESEDEIAVAGKVTGSDVRFREGPDTSSKIIATLSKGTYIEVLAVNNGWYKAIYNETQGYISAEYVDIVSDSDSAENDSKASGAGDPVSSDAAALRSEIVAYAKTFLGCKYVYGTANGTTFDCSGLTSYVYKHFGYSLNRSASGQLSNGTKVEKSNLVEGDLVFFRDTKISSKAASHVGMYVGSGQFIHASSGSSKRKVVISNLSDSYYNRVYVGARRIVK